MDNIMGWLFRYRLLWHILFWVVWYFFYIITYSTGFFEKTQVLFNLYLLPVRMAATYSLLYWILPNFLLKKKYLQFFILTLINAILFGLSIFFVLLAATGYGGGDALLFIRPLVLNYQIPATAAAIYMFKRWYLVRQYSLDLEKEKLESELQFLRSQLHPHFLFNTLNNLYALTLKKSDRAPEMVIQLSNLLEYALYSGRETEASLNEELNQLKGYIDLEKLRFGQRLKINTEIPEPAGGWLIAPLLLLPFVENSFKHGAGTSSDSPFIDLKIKLDDGRLSFSLKNSYHSGSGKFEKYNERIGLKNAKRRLELLYPGKHSLEIIQEAEIFSVYLKLTLNQEGYKKPANAV